MKNLRIIFLFVAFLGTGLAFSSCGDGTNKTTKEATEKQGKEYTSAYVCPMHCEGSGSDEAGSCPVCKMDYVQNENSTHEGNNHDGHDHDGHSH